MNYKSNFTAKLAMIGTREESKSSKRIFTIAALLAIALACGGCATSPDNRVAKFFELPHLSPLPSEIPKHASPSTVRSLLGEPEWTEKLLPKAHPGKRGAKGDWPANVTYVWHYTDRWHRDNMGSWDIYFREAPGAGDPRYTYAGWRLVDPVSAETGDREVLFSPPNNR